MPGLVLRDDKDGLTTLTLNRPDKLNALNVEMFVELRGHIDQIAEQTDRVGLVVVRGAGRGFSAGNDLGGIAAGQRPFRIRPIAFRLRQMSGGQRAPPGTAGVHRVMTGAFFDGELRKMLRPVDFARKGRIGLDAYEMRPTIFVVVKAGQAQDA